MNKLSQKIVKLLKKKKLKISVAESCTGGMFSSVLTSVSGSSKVFTMGFVTYSNQSKNHLLKVPKQIIKKYGAVSHEVCLLMLTNINKIAKTNMSISITGIAGPKGGSKKKPVGLVYIGIKSGNRIKTKKYLFKNKGRFYIQNKAAKTALKLILTFLK